jgi:hypothetical protein
VITIRSGDRAIAAVRRVYVRLDVDPPVVDGEALDEVCRG